MFGGLVQKELYGDKMFKTVEMIMDLDRQGDTLNTAPPHNIPQPYVSYGDVNHRSH